jgi:hypothetical protein
MVTGVPTFRWGIFTQNGISMTGSSGTDGYNSGEGLYNPLDIDSTGSMATNGNISVSGTIKGDATAVGTISATVTGSKTASAPLFPVMPVLNCPATGYTPPAQVSSGSGISYVPATGVLKVSGGKNVTLSGASPYYFSSIILSGGSTVTLPVGVHNDIWIDTELDLSGGGILNTSSRPTDLGLWSCGPNADTWTLSGGSGAYFSVYAPNHPITITGGSDIYGAIVGASLAASGGSMVHFDAALMNAHTNVLLVIRRSWTELTLY